MPRTRRQRALTRRALSSWLALVALVASGASCGFEPSPAGLHFELAPSTLAATERSPGARAEITRLLADLFGGPAAPVYRPNPAWPDGVDVDHPFSDAYPTLAQSAELYRRECLHCHGVEGGGDGPSAHGLSPRPRDFRLGVFQYTALSGQSRPRREDILRTLEQGVPGTSMPNFQRLAPPAREGLVDYVRFLAIRGEVESVLALTWKDEERVDAEALDEAADLVWSRWQRAATKLVVFDGVVPSSSPERIARGEALFHDPLRGNCASCHGSAGAGDGPAAWKIDVDGRRTSAYVDVWGRTVAPRDLRTGVFRGGARPIDLYRRVFAGIPGGPMPAMGEMRDKDGQLLLSPDDIWCLVHYVRSLSALGEEP